MNKTVISLIEDEIKRLTAVQGKIADQMDIARGELAELDKDWEWYDRIIMDLAEALDEVR